MFVLSEPKKSHTEERLPVVENTCKAGTTVIAYILFIYYSTGCGTTSATFGQGKTTL